MGPRERLRLGGIYGPVASLHLLGWGLFACAAGHSVALAGLGPTAYLFGLRHAFDADPIAAVDDTIHYLLRKGKRPLGAGWFFSPGRSTIAFALAPAIVPAAALVKQTLPVLQQHAGLIGAPCPACSRGSSAFSTCWCCWNRRSGAI